MEERKEGYIQVRKAYILVAGIIAASFLGGWFAFHFIQAPQIIHNTNATSYQQGFHDGYVNSVKDIYQFNNKLENLVVADQKDGMALMNGTAVTFVWRDQGSNNTLVMNFRASEDNGQNTLQGTLFLMTSPVRWPQSVVQAFNTQQPEYFLFQSITGQRYALERLS